MEYCHEGGYFGVGDGGYGPADLHDCGANRGLVGAGDAPEAGTRFVTNLLSQRREVGEFRKRYKWMGKIVANELIELVLDSREWHKTTEDEYEVRVIFEFEALESGATKMSISEQGWKTDTEGLQGSHDNCSGWTHMAMCLKAWLEHGIDLR
jgi:uncharacterized protein YndB with AHSA1/START domain